MYISIHWPETFPKYFCLTVKYLTSNCLNTLFLQRRLQNVPNPKLCTCSWLCTYAYALTSERLTLTELHLQALCGQQ